MNAHEIIVKIVGEGERVLDVGAGRGELAKRLAENGCDITVIEPNKGLANVAMASASRTIVDSIESVELDFCEEFDVILFADVLEHLVNPWQTLKKVRPSIKKYGRLVVSIPNVANWRMRLGLLAGSFDYAGQGILDRTHLHFYTQKTARRLIESAGYNVNEVKFVPSFPFPWFKECLSKISPNAFSFQFVFVCDRKESWQ